MLYLLFQLGKDRYAMNTAEVVEVLPLVLHKRIPQAPAYVAGAFTYRGAPVPLIDLAQLSLGKASRMLMSTRIVLVRYVQDGGESHLLGLLAEHATETISRRRDEFVETGVAVDGAPYLGPVTSDSRGIIQRIEVNRLLPPHAREMLFRPQTEPQ